MTVSNTSASGNPTAGAPATRGPQSALSSPPPPPPPPPPPSSSTNALSTALRTFAAIRCSSCQYLEFPGCDVHGVLYTEHVVLSSPLAAVEGGDTPPIHAKCPNCAAATHNVRPFRDGCRRCKAATTVHMWSASPRELSRAHAAFPTTTGDEIAHSVLLCDACGSIVFPRARDELTTRTARDPLLATGGRALQVANFQLSMPHADGCPRRGMPLHVVPVRLPRSELQFVRDRVEQCPLASAVDGAPQYRARGTALVAEQNHLDQVMLRVLTGVMNAFDPVSAAAVQPLQQMVGLLDHLEPLSLFSNWAPPRRLSQVTPIPTRITASSEVDKQHGPMRILEAGSGFWLSATPTVDSIQPEWLVFEFASPLVISTVTLRWKADNAPNHFSIALSCDGTSYETAAIVTERAATSRVAISKGVAVKTIKLTLFETKPANTAFGLESAQFREAIDDSIHTPTSALLRSLQQWLLDASASESIMARDLALHAAEKLALATGSLCGLLHLAATLVLHSSPLATDGVPKHNEQDWQRFDELSETAQQFSQRFLVELCKSAQRLMSDAKTLESSSPASISTLAAGSQGQQDAHSNGPEASVSTAKTTSSSGNADNGAVSSSSDKALNLEDYASGHVISLLTAKPNALCAIKRRSQLGVMILHVLGELAAWEMQRMQKVEDLLSSKRADELTMLEAPYAMEIRREFFDISHRLLQRVLAEWLTSSTAVEVLRPEMDGEGGTNLSSNDDVKDSVHLYGTLSVSLAELRGSFVDNPAALPTTPTHAGLVDSKSALFSPDGMCVALLQIVTSNIRRLVLSRIDPWDIEGTTPASNLLPKSDEDLLAAPPALQPMVESLEKLISLGSKRSDKFFPISLKAAAAVEVGLEAFYPSALQRTKLLTSRMGKGATLEMQVRWPVQERDQEDPRYERLMLMLQFECIRMGWQHAIRGSWRFFMHLIVEVPAATETEQALVKHFAPCIHKAGFAAWQVAAGAQEIGISLQRHLHWNRVEKMCQEAGVGWIRVYPRDVAGFNDVLVDVESFLSEQSLADDAPTAP